VRTNTFRFPRVRCVPRFDIVSDGVVVFQDEVI